MIGRFIAILLLTSAHASAAQISVCFTPAQQCESLVVNAIKAAKTEILVQGYGFSDLAILKALVDANVRHVKVLVLLDKSSITGAKYMNSAGIPVWIDNKVAIAHNKVMIIDQKLVLTGSYNWTVNAQKRNAENLLFIHNSAIAVLYSNNWQSRQKISIVYEIPK